MKLPQAINKNNKLNAENVCYLGTTGSCKTTAIQRLDFIKKSDQVIIFDPYGDHAGIKIAGVKVVGFDSFDTFYTAAWLARKERAPFRLALVGQMRTLENLELFAQMAWSLLDGKHPKRLHCVIEELAKFTDSSAKLTGTAGELWTGGRGFGAVMHTSFQRGQEVPKTVLDESAYFYIGAVSTPRNAKYVSETLGVPYDDVISLKSFRDTLTHADYLLKSPGIGNWTKGKIDPRT